MCNFFSVVLTKDEAFWGESDSHEAIIRGANQKRQPLHADGLKGPNVLRTELLPSVKTKRLEDFDSYEFVIDQDILPAWYDKADAAARTLAALKERFPKRKVDKVGTLIIPEKSNIVGKWLTSVGGDLLYVNADAQLPALTSVGGTIYVKAGGTLEAPQLVQVNGKKWPSTE